MKTLKGGLVVAAVVFGLGLLGSANTASAAYPYVVYNGGYVGYGGYGGGYIGYGGTYPVYSGYGSLYGRSYGPTWHDTSHFDYHPGGFVRHGNHLHYQPGHYDLHRTGHWHP